MDETSNFTWAQFVTSFLLVLAFPPLEAAAVMQLMDRVAGTSFFLPSGLVMSGEIVDVAGSGSPLLWQHLFWFLAHPEVYVLILPALGIVGEILAIILENQFGGLNPLFTLWYFWVYLFYCLGTSHVFNRYGSSDECIFQTTTMIISIPSVVILTSYFYRYGVDQLDLILLCFLL